MKLYLYLILVALILTGCTEEPKTSQVTNQDFPLFIPLYSDFTGLKFNESGKHMMKGDASGLYSNISAVAVGDLNNDGLPDIVFSGGHENSGLFFNEGDLKFKDVTQRAGLIDFGSKYFDTEGINLVDINGDGWLDIYVLKSGLTGNFKTGEYTKDGANMLFINQRDGTFKEEASNYGLDLIGLSHSAQFFDYDGDGDLDLYLAQTPESGASFSFSYYEKKPTSPWFNDQFLENQNGQFIDVREKVGLPSVRNIPLSVTVLDVNRDGNLDLYVANDFFGPDFFYLNNGGNGFKDAYSEYFSKGAMSAMGSDFGDIDNDGFFDLFVGEMMPVGHDRQKTNLVPFSIEIYNRLERQNQAQYTRNILNRNYNGEYFKDIGMLSKVHATEWSWSCFFLDADLDGRKDLYVANGILRDMTNMDFVKSNFGEDYTKMADPEYKAKARNYEAPKIKTSNFMFRNDGEWNFENKTRKWNMDQPIQSRGGTYADLDVDGDLDIVLNVMDGSPVLYRNTLMENTNTNYLKLKLRGPGNNTFGIGATVDVFIGKDRMTDMLSNVRGFQSGPEPILVFGLGEEKNVDSVAITWPGGKCELFTQVKANQVSVLEYGTGNSTSVKGSGKKKWSVTEMGKGIHRENSFSDFKYNRLALRLQTKEGPGIAIGDLNGDSQDDIVLTQSRGKSSISVIEGNEIEISTSNSEDLGSCIFDFNGDGTNDIYLCRGGDEKSSTDILLIGNGKGGFEDKSDSYIPNSRFGSRGISVGDFNGDGEPDIFVYGRADIEGNPNGGCALWFKEGDKWVDHTSSLPEDFDKGGLIKSAICTDANLDGRPDLMVVGHWRECQLLLNQESGFETVSLPNSAGWWNSVSAVDVDNDGDMDYVMGNYGENTYLNASIDKPISLVHYDFDKNGEKDALIFAYNGSVNAPVVNRDLLTRHMPALNQKYFSFKKYAEANMDNMLADASASEVELKKITELKSGIWINNDLNFNFVPLPNQVQSAPVFGILSEDFNSDGNVDLLISGNSNIEHFEVGDLDALGVVLIWGDGKGQFAFDSQKSTIANEGFYKGLVWKDDVDGPVILAARNGRAIQQIKFSNWDSYERLPTGKWNAQVTLTNDRIRRVEFPIGGGYLSQSAPLIIKNDLVIRIE